MAEKKPAKHHQICTKCGVQSTGKSIKECIEKFPSCGTPGIGPITNSCKLSILQDGKPIVKLLEITEYEKLLKAATKAAAKPKVKTPNQVLPLEAPVKVETPKNTKNTSKKS